MAGPVVLVLLMRWIHILSTVLLVGGVAYARWVALPAIQVVSPAERPAAWARLAAGFRPLLYASMGGLLVSGLYSFLLRLGTLSPGYFTWFAVKMLLVAHIFAVGLIIVKPPSGKPEDESRRARQMSGLVISGALAALIATVALRLF
jgi:hypothetical protein